MANILANLARETATTATATAMFDCWRWCSCWQPCSRAAGPSDPWGALEAEKTRGAIQSLRTALGALGGCLRQGGFRDKCGGDLVKDALYLLEFGWPSPKNAANALIMIGYVADSCDEEAASAVKAAERAVRDVVVLRCCAPGGVWTIAHGDILKALEVAFDRPLQGDFLPHADRELRAMLLLAFHKVRRDA